MQSRTSSSKRSKPRPELGQPDAGFGFDAIGTHWRIDLWDVPSGYDVDALKARIFKRIDVFDKTYSRFRSDSLVTAISRQAGAGEYRFPADAGQIFAYYRQLYDLTAGAVTPLIGQTLSDAGYDAHYSLKPGHMRPPPAWDEAMSFDGRVLKTNQPVLLDIGAAGKGYLVDIVAGLIRKSGDVRYCINAGGDLLVRSGQSSLPVALEHPDDPELAVGVAHLQDEALCGSAGNRRVWDNFHHIINPKTLESPSHLRAVWVAAKDCMLADGLTTALYFTSPERLAEQFAVEYAMIYQDGRLGLSPGFPAEFFTQEG